MQLWILLQGHCRTLIQTATWGRLRYLLALALLSLLVLMGLLLLMALLLLDEGTCVKSFTTSGHLTVHRRTHSDDKPYPCTTCDNAFTTSSQLKEHIP